jgi:hypothetical protein
MLGEWGLPELIDDGELIASELVTNVVRRAHDPDSGKPILVNGRVPALELGLFCDGAELLISVGDQFPEPPVPGTATGEDESGRGLFMVGRIAARLDWHPTPYGKVVRALLAASCPATVIALAPSLPQDRERTDVTASSCPCGFTERADETLTDHLERVFVPAGSIGNDGLVHEENATGTCSCGLAAATPGDLDAHFLAMFTPGDAIGSDGRKHERAQASEDD